MIYLAVISIVLVAIGMWLSPRGQMTHAAVSSDVFRRERLFPFAGFYRDSSGNHIDIGNSVIAKAYGPSCRDFGIPDGSVVIAARLKGSSEDREVAPGDVVIINSQIENGSKPHRFRCVDHIDGETVYFRSGDRDYRPKPLTDLVGKVTYVSA